MYNIKSIPNTPGLYADDITATRSNIQTTNEHIQSTYTINTYNQHIQSIHKSTHTLNTYNQLKQYKKYDYAQLRKKDFYTPNPTVYNT